MKKHIKTRSVVRDNSTKINALKLRETGKTDVIYPGPKTVVRLFNVIATLESAPSGAAAVPGGLWRTVLFLSRPTPVTNELRR